MGTASAWQAMKRCNHHCALQDTCNVQMRHATFVHGCGDWSQPPPAPEKQSSRLNLVDQHALIFRATFGPGPERTIRYRHPKTRTSTRACTHAHSDGGGQDNKNTFMTARLLAPPRLPKQVVFQALLQLLQLLLLCSNNGNSFPAPVFVLQHDPVRTLDGPKSGNQISDFEGGQL